MLHRFALSIAFLMGVTFVGCGGDAGPKDTPSDAAADDTSLPLGDAGGAGADANETSPSIDSDAQADAHADGSTDVGVGPGGDRFWWGTPP